MVVADDQVVRGERPVQQRPGGPYPLAEAGDAAAEGIAPRQRPARVQALGVPVLWPGPVVNRTSTHADIHAI